MSYLGGSMVHIVIIIDLEILLVIHIPKREYRGWEEGGVISVCSLSFVHFCVCVGGGGGIR